MTEDMYHSTVFGESERTLIVPYRFPMVKSKYKPRYHCHLTIFTYICLPLRYDQHIHVGTVLTLLPARSSVMNNDIRHPPQMSTHISTAHQLLPSISASSSHRLLSIFNPLYRSSCADHHSSRASCSVYRVIYLATSATVRWLGGKRIIHVCMGADEKTSNTPTLTLLSLSPMTTYGLLSSVGMRR